MCPVRTLPREGEHVGTCVTRMKRNSSGCGVSNLSAAGDVVLGYRKASDVAGSHVIGPAGRLK